jgi:hypothetical protein
MPLTLNAKHRKIGRMAKLLRPVLPSDAVMGDIDRSFGNDGTRSDWFSGNAFEYGDSAVQPDGKIVTVGTCTTTGSFITSFNGKYFCAKRFLVDGSVDTTFGTNGYWYDRDTSSLGLSRGYDSVASSVLILSDGNILIGGTCRSNQACMARLTSAGVREIAFMRETTYAAIVGSPTTRLAETASGNYLIHYSRNAATNDRQLMTVANFTPSGVPNTLFGTNGVFIEGFSQPNARYTPKGIVTLNDSMWLGGELEIFGARYLRLHKLTAAGVSDQLGTNTVVNVLLGAAGEGLVFSVAAISAGATANRRIAATVVSNGKLAVYRMDDTGYADDGWFTGGLKLTAVTAADPTPACQYSGGVALPLGGYVFTGGHLAGATETHGLVGYCLSQFDASLNPLATALVPSWFTAVYAAPSSVRPTLAREGRMLLGGDCGLSMGSACLQRYDILPKNCYDMDGDGQTTPAIDGVILARLLAGFKDSALTQGLTISSTAIRKTPALIQSHFNSCQSSQFGSCYRVTGLGSVSAQGLLYDGLAVMRAEQGLRGEALRLSDGRYVAQNFMGYTCGLRDLLR